MNWAFGGLARAVGNLSLAGNGPYQWFEAMRGFVLLFSMSNWRAHSIKNGS